MERTEYKGWEIFKSKFTLGATERVVYDARPVGMSGFPIQFAGSVVAVESAIEGFAGSDNEAESKEETR